MNQKNFKSLISKLYLTLPCPRCRQNYNKESGNIISFFANHVLLELFCGKCESTVLASVLVADGKAKFKTDLSLKEMAKFSKSMPISSDEVIEIYRTLEKMIKR